MPKLKTNSSVKKRFGVRGNGSLKRSKSGNQHLARNKSTKQNYKGMALVQHQEEKNILEHFVPYSN